MCIGGYRLIGCRQSTAPSPIRLKAKLLQPVSPKGASWAFLVLPRTASAMLPTRAMTSVEGTLNDIPFRATLSPDGERSHWLEVPRKLQAGARAAIGDVVTVALAPATRGLEPRLPADLRKALAASPKARALWSEITPGARRIANAMDMLAGGKRRVCCFDRSGFYSKGFGAPRAA